MEIRERYKHLNSYLKNKFGERTLKICIDGNFTCPNRDGKVGTSGCIFCSERGSGEHILCNHIENDIDSIQNQVKSYFISYKATRANKFIAYFQNFTNTYDTISNLKAKYNAALIDNRIVGLEIATRPDCINENIVKLIKSYAENYYVCVELGLSHSVYSLWTEKTIPRRTTLIKIADYFGVTPESLVAENQPKKDPSQMDGQENEIVKIFSALLPEQQEQAKKYLRYLLDTQEKTSL